VISPSGKGNYQHVRKGKKKTIVVPGHYISTNVARLRYRNIPLRYPVVSGKTVTPGDPVFLQSSGNVIDFCRDVIRPEEYPTYATLPSIRASDGLCIRVDGDRNMGHIPEVVLMARFSKAVHWRNWYAFMRAGFASRDDLRSYFPTFLYPKKSADDIDIFSGAAVDIVTFSPSPAEGVYSFIEVTPSDLIERSLMDEIVEKVHDLLARDGDFMLNFLLTLEYDDVKKLELGYKELKAMTLLYSIANIKLGIQEYMRRKNIPKIDMEKISDDDPRVIDLKARYGKYFDDEEEYEVPLVPVVVAPPPEIVQVEDDEDPFKTANQEIVLHKPEGSLI